MERYLSIPLSAIVALMAAHRAAAGAERPPYSQEQIARIDAYLRETNDPIPRRPVAASAISPEGHVSWVREDTVVK